MGVTSPSLSVSALILLLYICSSDIFLSYMLACGVSSSQERAAPICRHERRYPRTSSPAQSRRRCIRCCRSFARRSGSAHLPLTDWQGRARTPRRQADRARRRRRWTFRHPRRTTCILARLVQRCGWRSRGLSRHAGARAAGRLHGARECRSERARVWRCGRCGRRCGRSRWCARRC